jgi:hypothetical protein
LRLTEELAARLGVRVLHRRSHPGPPPSGDDSWTNVPADETGKPDLSKFDRPAEFYYGVLVEYGEYMAASAREDNAERWTEGARWWNRRVMAEWGLIARGAESIPYALKLLSSREPDNRSAGSAALSEIGKQPGVVQSMIGALDLETEIEARDTMIQSLGRLKDRDAIPKLAEIIRASDKDGDTRWTAIEALGVIVRRRFLKLPDPAAAAAEWLEKHGYN